MGKGLKGRLTVRVMGSDAVERLKKQMESAGRRAVVVGVLEGAGNYTRGKDPPGVAQVAAWNEFGTETIPERSFIRSAGSEKREKIAAWQAELMAKVLEEKITIEKALEALGFRMQALVQNKIKSNVPPPNADSTRARKRLRGNMGNRTLIDTGLMLRSIRFQVIGAGEGDG